MTEWLAGRESSLLQPTVSYPNGKQEMQQIVDAMEKALDNADELKTADPSDSAAGSASPQAVQRTRKDIGPPRPNAIRLCSPGDTPGHRTRRTTA
ncbi:MAG TPA: hypothetical protein VLM91_17930 [Candidatus Methylomirabilis sp.]|nr:hypothetical protein [Candidatus Methylomirabilis sp.]